jgi:hypothetical protein
MKTGPWSICGKPSHNELVNGFCGAWWYSFHLTVQVSASFGRRSDIGTFHNSLSSKVSGRMFKKVVFSPAQPWRAETCLVPGKAADEKKPEA